MTVLGIAVQSSATTPYSCLLTRYVQVDDWGTADFPDTGERVPARPVTCYIDFSSRTVTFSPDISDSVTSYEIWTEDQSLCLGSYTDDASFVEDLTTQVQTVTLIFNLGTYGYTGFYNP